MLSALRIRTPETFECLDFMLGDVDTHENLFKLDLQPIPVHGHRSPMVSS